MKKRNVLILFLLAIIIALRVDDIKASEMPDLVCSYSSENGKSTALLETYYDKEDREGDYTFTITRVDAKTERNTEEFNNDDYVEDNLTTSSGRLVCPPEVRFYHNVDYEIWAGPLIYYDPQDNFSAANAAYKDPMQMFKVGFTKSGEDLEEEKDEWYDSNGESSESYAKTEEYKDRIDDLILESIIVYKDYDEETERFTSFDVCKRDGKKCEPYDIKANDLDDFDWQDLIDANYEEFRACENTSVLKTFRIIGYILTILKIGVPVLLIIFTLIALFKAFIGGDQKDVDAAISSSVKKVIAGILIFFIPTIVELVLKTTDLYKSEEYYNTDSVGDEHFYKCTTCFLDPDSDKCESFIKATENKK